MRDQGYGQRSREVAPLPEVTAGPQGMLHLTVYVDHSILTIFANDAAVITTRVYTAGGNNSAGVSFYAEGLAATGVQGTASVWPLSL